MMPEIRHKPTWPRRLRWLRARLARLRGRGQEILPASAAAQNARYDAEALEVVRRCLSDNSMGIDGGAHRGDFLDALCAIAPRGPHLAFEPLPDMAARLRREFPAVRVQEAALGDEPGPARFRHVVDAPAFSGLRRRDYPWDEPEIETIDVDVVRLDDVLGPEDRPALIKLDLEGGEYHALRGARETLRRCRPVVIFEAGEGSSGHYGVTPDMFFDLLAMDCGLAVNTMARWLHGDSALDRQAFIEVSQREFYFLAAPPRLRR